MATTELQDPEIEVRDLDHPENFITWRISQNLTDRWGEINDCDAEHKPLDLLLNTAGLLTKLRNQMVGETTFIVRKDGEFGILFELEFATQKSEKAAGDPEWAFYRSREEMLRILVKAAKRFQVEFPLVEWAIPSEQEICDDRLALWGFFRDGTLTEEQRSAVYDAIRRI